MFFGHKYTLLTIFCSVCADCVAFQSATFNDASAASTVVRNWIDNKLTVEASDSEEIIGDEVSVCIVLRHHGNVIGVGTCSGEINNPIEIASLIAFSEVEDNKILSQLKPDIKQSAYSAMSIELELGNKPVPSPHRKFERFAQTVNVGIDGLAVRRGNDWEIRLPAMARLSPQQDVLNIVSTLCINAGIHPATALAHQLPENDDSRLYTFPTVTVVQDRSGEVPRELIRGDELVKSNYFTPSGMRNIADLLSSHLIACTIEGGYVIGGYQPETDSLTTLLSSKIVQAMTACALQKYATTNGVSLAAESLKKSSSILNNLANEFNEQKQPTIAEAAAIVIALTSSNTNQNQNSENLYALCRKIIIRFSKDISENEILTNKPHELAMVAAAISTIVLHENNSDLLPIAEEVCSVCLNNIPVESSASMIPWIVDAVLDLQTHGSNISMQPIVDLLNTAIVMQVELGCDYDLVGGFALMSNGRTSIDARGIRMLPSLARLISENENFRSKTLGSLIRCSRFTAQITTREQRASRFQNPAMAIGGVRSSTWDATMPTEATAMALIGIVQTINTFQTTTIGK